MYIGLVEVCSDPTIGNILHTVQNIMAIFQVIVPIVSIVALIKLLIKKIADPDNKKLTNGFRNWIILLITFFLLPVIINATMGAIAEADNPGSEDFSFAACWNYARGSSYNNSRGSYQKTQEENNRKKITG